MILQAAPTSTQLVQLGANVVLAIFTVVLAWATWQYAQQSKAQTAEMEKSREAEFRPFLKAATNLQDGGWTHFLIENIGIGTAQNVEVRYYVEGAEDSDRSWGVPLLHPEENYWFGFPLNDHTIGSRPGVDQLEETLEGTEGNLVVEMEYDDALENHWQRTDRIDILEEIQSRTEADEFYVGNETG